MRSPLVIAQDREKRDAMRLAPTAYPTG
jgi:hypothetical protein